MNDDQNVLFQKNEISVYKVPDNLTKNSLAKLSKWKPDSSDWDGTFKVIVDNDNIISILLENDTNGKLHAKCSLHEYPSPLIETIATDNGKLFFIHFETTKGQEVRYCVEFYSKHSTSEVKSMIKDYFKNIKRKNKKMLDESNKQVTNKKTPELCVKYFDTIILEEEKLPKDTHYDDVIGKFNKLCEDTLNMKSSNESENIFKKFRTPLENVVIPQNSNDLQEKIKNKANNGKKRSAKNANEISLIHEEADNTDAAVPEIRKLRPGTKNLQENLIEDVKLTKPKNDGSKKKNESQASKKLRMSSNESIVEVENEEEEVAVQKKIKPSRAAKNKANAKLSNHKKNSKSRRNTSTSSSASLTSQNQIKTDKKHQLQEQEQQQTTPPRNTVRLQSLMESNSKTIKAVEQSATAPRRPVTRGKVRQMVEKVEQNIRIITNSCKPSATSSSGSSSSDRNSRRILRPNPKIRASIDKRKLRVSLAKAEAKRKSAKQVNAFLKHIKQEHQNELNASKQQLQVLPTPSKFTSSNQADRTINEIKTDKRLTQNILSSSTIQQHYRVMTTKPPTAKPLERKLSYIKFMERNTPSKLTKTELEDKRKAEMLSKEIKEQQRIQEREKQKQEKIEQAKKKREEKMKQIAESKAKRQEDEERRREEYEQKCKEIEENKKRVFEEKKKEFHSKQLEIKEKLTEEQKRKHEETKNALAGLHNSAVKSNIYQAKPLSMMAPTPTIGSKLADYNQGKPFTVLNNKPNIMPKHLETTYVLNTPGNNHILQSKHVQNQNQPAVVKKLPFSTATHAAAAPTGASLTVASSSHSESNQNYPVTPLTQQVYKLKDPDNYDVSNLKSDDDTDDDEEPTKPIPDWAKWDRVSEKTTGQCHKVLNYTKLFKSSSNCEIKLDQIFRTRRKKFTERSSSANWSSPPIWHTGINGDMSFRKQHYYS